MTSPYFTRTEAADYLRRSPQAFDEWARRRGVQPEARVGTSPLFTRATIERVIRLDRDKTPKRRQVSA